MTLAKPSSAVTARRSALLAILAGTVFGVIFVKLGTPVILAEKVHTPKNTLEVMMLSWPVGWGYALLGLFLLAAVALAWGLSGAPQQRLAGGWSRCLGWCLVGWLGWQILAATQSVEPRLTRLVLPHFLACVACFVAGRFVLSRTTFPELFWLLLTAGFLVTVVGGWDQHFGGLEETRRQFEQLPAAWRERWDTPEFRARLASDRVFSTFFYPNAFAGGLLLLLPAATTLVWRMAVRRGRALAWTASGALALAGLLCLYWSGSKAGWLIALIMAGVVLGLSSLTRALRIGLVMVMLVGGGAVFFFKYSGYLARGAPSAGARMDYWRVAWQAAWRHPVLGTGPGTFSAVYRQSKPPAAEPTQLAHNDYLQQASDSGWPGFLAYAVFLGGMLVSLRPERWTADWRPAAWLGVLGWAAQGMVEFGLYIPALAWPVFLFLGWLRAAGQARMGAT